MTFEELAIVRPKNETGMQISASGDGILIANNQIFANDRMIVNTVGGNDDRGANGIVLYETTGHITVTGNRIWGNRAVSYDYGYDGGAFEIYAASNVYISDNVMWDNENVLETGTEGGALCDNNTFVRNVAYKGSTTSVAGPSEGVVLRCASNMLVASNTFDGFDRFTFDVTATGSFAGSVDGLRILDNIARSSKDKIFSIDSALPSSVVIDYTLAYNTSGTNIAYYYAQTNTWTLSTFAAWTGYEVHGIQADPAFVGGGDYHLLPASPAIDAGTTIAGLTDGYFGAAPDMGRYEFTP